MSRAFWLIGANEAVYGKGSTCQSQTLVGPKNRPKSGIVGAIILASGGKGFEMVTAAGRGDRPAQPTECHPRIDPNRKGG